MVKIRLKRLGRKHRPFYRIVVTNIRNRRDGAPIAELGYYNPVSKELKLDKQEALAWIGKGAIPSETAQRLINRADESGQLIKLEINKAARLSKKAKSKADAEAAEKAAAAEAATTAAAAPAAEEAPAATEDAAPAEA